MKTTPSTSSSTSTSSSMMSTSTTIPPSTPINWLTKLTSQKLNPNHPHLHHRLLPDLQHTNPPFNLKGICFHIIGTFNNPKRVDLEAWIKHHHGTISPTWANNRVRCVLVASKTREESQENLKQHYTELIQAKLIFRESQFTPSMWKTIVERVTQLNEKHFNNREAREFTPIPNHYPSTSSDDKRNENVSSSSSSSSLSPSISTTTSSALSFLSSPSSSEKINNNRKRSYPRRERNQTMEESFGIVLNHGDDNVSLTSSSSSSRSDARLLLCEQLQPRRSSDYIGCREGIKKLQSFLHRWTRQGSKTTTTTTTTTTVVTRDDFESSTAMIITGRPGTGKTSIVFLVAKESGFDRVEYLDASVSRSRTILSHVCDQLTMISKSTHAKCLLILDEMEGLGGSGDSGALPFLTSFLAKRHKDSTLSSSTTHVEGEELRYHDLPFPIIGISNQLAITSSQQEEEDSKMPQTTSFTTFVRKTRHSGLAIYLDWFGPHPNEVHQWYIQYRKMIMDVLLTDHHVDKDQERLDHIVNHYLDHYRIDQSIDMRRFWNYVMFYFSPLYSSCSSTDAQSDMKVPLLSSPLSSSSPLLTPITSHTKVQHEFNEFFEKLSRTRGRHQISSVQSLDDLSKLVDEMTELNHCITQYPEFHALQDYSLGRLQYKYQQQFDDLQQQRHIDSNSSYQNKKKLFQQPAAISRMHRALYHQSQLI